MSFNLQGQVGLVTGAGRGIGRACAEGLAASGARVIAVARSESDLAELRAHESGRIDTWAADVTDQAFIDRIGTIEGPIAGSFIFVLLSQTLAEYFSVSMLILGAIAILVILLAPKGIMGSLQEKLGFEILSPRRK